MVRRGPSPVDPSCCRLLTLTMSTTHCVEITKILLSDTVRAAGVALPEPSPIPYSSTTTRYGAAHLCFMVINIAVHRAGSGPEVQEPQHHYYMRGKCQTWVRGSFIHSYGFCIVAWDSTEEEHNPILDATPEVSVELPKGCSQEYKIHVHLQCEPFTAMDAPLTEVVLWKLKSHAEKAKVEELLTGLMEIVNKIPRSEGMHKAGWGSVVENERQYVVMIGWDTMEVCRTPRST